MEQFDDILASYRPEDSKIVCDTVNELCEHGIPKGCYQNYAVLNDILRVLGIFESLVKIKGDENEQNSESKRASIEIR